MQRIVVCLLLLASGVTAAGELSLYEHPRFQGRSVTVQQAAADLAALRFENQASSLIIRDGTWELCTEPLFRGICRTFGPGEYSQLGELGDRIRSARELGGAGNRANPELTVFEHGSFGGRSVTLRGPVTSLESVGMNDAVSSLMARGAVWELCVHANFTPPCRQFGPGDHVEVGEQFNDQFSSARPLSGGSSFPSSPPAQAPVPVRSSRIDLILFDNEEFSGDARGIGQAFESLDQLVFNDRASSVVVVRGQWELCSEAGFRGTCRTLAPGDHPSLEGGLNNRVSSVRPAGTASGTVPSPWGSGGNWSGRSARGGSVTLYEYVEFIGRSQTVTQAITSLEEIGFNDRASSIVVDRGIWEFCTDANFRGTCRTVGPGRYGSIPYELDSKISSMRQVSQ